MSFVSCLQSNNKVESKDAKEEVINNESDDKITEPHQYGGWYCPDNLNGFPSVDITNWKNVPIINGRMATKEDTQNGSSLIFLDTLKYPNAKVLDITMPKLASYKNNYSNRDDLVIVIQAIKIDKDSIVGFRYLNGGNGSARLNEVRFLSGNEIKMLPTSRFVSLNISIKATQDSIWKVLTKPKSTETLRSIFDKSNKLNTYWKETSNVNYHYPNSGVITASYANKLFGNFYIQNDYDNFQYSEKFLLLENENTKITELKIVCGPYGTDYESQKRILTIWAQKVKALSEKE